jgi:hypothetical protein
VLEANAVGLDADLRRAAIGARAGAAALIDPGEGEWGYRMQSGGRGEQLPVLAAAHSSPRARRGRRPFLARDRHRGREDGLFSADTGPGRRIPRCSSSRLHDWPLLRSASSRNFLRVYRRARPRLRLHRREHLLHRQPVDVEGFMLESAPMTRRFFFGFFYSRPRAEGTG